MTEEIGGQDLIDVKIKLLEQLKSAPYKQRLKASHKPFGAGFEPPSLEEIREAFNPYTGAEVGEMLGVDARAVRRWLQDPDTTKGSREIPYAAWRLFLIITGKIPAV